jgi:hypothetical protein
MFSESLERMFGREYGRKTDVYRYIWWMFITISKSKSGSTQVNKVSQATYFGHFE